MTKMLKCFITPLIIFSVAILFTSCKKEEGIGGNSTIYGKVLVKDYNSTFTVLQETYYGPGIWVYIIYGDNRDYNDRIQTSYNGTFEFQYLREGNYKLYVYSADSSLSTNAPIPVIQDAEITKNKQEVQLPDFVIFN